jgi:alkylated DNA repair dioxygenase AlkB
MAPMRGIPARPEGLRYVPEFLGAAAETELIGQFAGVEWGEVRMHGQVARRRVRHYGLDYAYEPAAISPGDPLPPWLTDLRRRAAELIARAPDELVECLLTHYPAGAGIGWHRDAPMFGDVVGVSLAAGCPLRFQRGRGSERQVFEQWLEPRSAYLLTGPSRTQWQHSIPAVAAERYSVTFRTLRRRAVNDRRPRLGSGAVGDQP